MNDRSTMDCDEFVKRVASAVSCGGRDARPRTHPIRPGQRPDFFRACFRAYGLADDLLRGITRAEVSGSFTAPVVR